jgi:transglutaminase-like putative cysteine protease
MPSQRINWHRSLTALFIVLFFFCISTPIVAANRLNSHEPQVNIVNPPTWIEIQTYRVADFVDLRSPTHYHLVDKQISGILNNTETNNNADRAPANKQVYSRFVYSLTDPSGIESNANIHIRFNPVYEILNIHGINVIRAGQLVNEVKRSDIDVINAEDRQSSNIYSGEVEAVVLLKDVRVGDVIDYSYTVVGSNPVFADKFSAGATIGWGITVDKINVSVLMPSDRPVQYKLFRSDGQISEQVKVQVKGDTTLYQLTLLDTPEIYAEDNLPAWYNPYPHIQFSEYQSWQEVANWANELFEVDKTPSAELTEFIASLKAKPLKDAIDEAINFSQNQIRYLGLELGENSHRPHTPAETFSNRQGDCKDKSLLLSVLLNQLGVTANPALVSTVNHLHVSDYLPSHGVFDHAIVEIEFAGTQYWIDPTITHQGARLTSKFQADYGLALVVSPETSDLVSAQPSTNNHSSIAIAENLIAADYSSAVEWQITTHMTGREADNLRYRLKSEGQVKIAKSYLNYYAKRYPKIEALDDLTIDDNIADNIVTIVEHYLVTDFWLLNQRQHAEFELQADFPSQYVQLPQSIKREQPLAIYPHITVDHKITLRLPEHVDFNLAPDSKLFADPYISFDSAISYDRRLLVFHNTYQAKSNYVKVADIAEHLALLNDISKRMKYYNSITNVSNDPGIPEMQTLLKNLNKRRLGRADNAGE